MLAKAFLFDAHAPAKSVDQERQGEERREVRADGEGERDVGCEGTDVARMAEPPVRAARDEPVPFDDGDVPRKVTVEGTHRPGPKSDPRAGHEKKRANEGRRGKLAMAVRGVFEQRNRLGSVHRPQNAAGAALVFVGARVSGAEIGLREIGGGVQSAAEGSCLPTVGKKRRNNQK